MRSEPARLGGISLDFAGIPPRWDENFGSIFFNQFCFTFQMLIK